MTGGTDLKFRARQATIPRTAIVLAALVLLGSVLLTGRIVDAASVSVTWNAPTTNADGSSLTDLSSYRIYLGTTTPACPSSSFLTVASPTSTPPSGQVVSSRVTALTAGTTYFARITAVDAVGNESACSPAASGVAQADITVTPTGTANLGSVSVGGSADTTFTVQNVSTTSVTGTASVGAPYSVVSGASFSLAAGASQVVTVRFSPATTGTFAGNVNFVASGDTISRGVSGTGVGVSTATLSVTTNGTGVGTVTSNPAGITCGSSCSASMPVGSTVTLTATAASGSTFAGWGGACSGTGSCSWTLNGNAAVTAAFAVTTAPSAPAMPSSATLGQGVADSAGVTFAVSGGTVGGATSYAWVAGFSDGSGAQQGSVTGTSLQLRMPYHSSGAAAPGFVCISAVNSAGQSADQACAGFTVPARPVSQPVPVAASLTPGSAVAGTSGLTLTVTGSAFSATSTVRWNGAARATTVVSSTQLIADITAADLASARSVSVSVYTPTPGGGTSANLTFTVTAAPAAPAVSSLSPASATAGSAGLTLTVNGSRFVTASVVRWNGSDRPTTFVSASQLRATISAADLSSVGTMAVTVFAPAPGGGTSGSLSFTVTAPSSTAVLPPPPASVTASLTGSDATGVTFTVSWSAVSGATSYRYAASFSDGSAAQQGTVSGMLSLPLRMPYHTSGAAATGGVCLRSVNSAGQSTTQSCVALSVPAAPSTTATPPVIKSLSPSSAVSGDPGVIITVSGTGFVSTSVGLWNGGARPTTYVSATTLRLTVSPFDLANATRATVSVTTPGVGTSSSLTFTITASVTVPLYFTVTPATPPSPTVRPGIADALGLPLAVSWGSAAGATSYRYVAAFSDGSALQQGPVASTSMDLRMPFHWSGKAMTAFVCIRSVNAAGESTDQACSGFSVPAR